MKNKIIYLSIASFVIKIILTRSKENAKFENGFFSTLIDHYKNFVIVPRGQNIDYSVEIKYEQLYKTLTNKTEKNIFICLYNQISSNYIQTFYHISGSQLQLLFRKITHDLLAKNNGFILHASASKIGKSAVLFLGKSGAGKSTVMTLLSSKFPPVGDDTVIIRKENGKYFCYSSSAIEKNDWFLKSRRRLDINSIFFLKKSEYNQVVPINDKDLSLNLVIKQFFSEKEDIEAQMKNLLAFVHDFDKFFFLKFNLTNIDELINLISKV